MKALSDSVHDLEEKLKKVAEFFCEDKKKFKIEELFMRLLKFVEQLPVLAKVRTLCIYIIELSNTYNYWILGKQTTRDHGKKES